MRKLLWLVIPVVFLAGCGALTYPAIPGATVEVAELRHIASELHDLFWLLFWLGLLGAFRG